MQACAGLSASVCPFGRAGVFAAACAHVRLHVCACMACNMLNSPADEQPSSGDRVVRTYKNIY